MRHLFPVVPAILLLAVIIPLIASSLPDGLEKVISALNPDQPASYQPVIPSPLPDYTVPGVNHRGVSAAAAGLIGTLICLLLPRAFLLILRKK